MDILVQIKNQYIDVEMNNNKEEYIKIRNATYLFNMVNESIEKGGNYAEMVKNEYIGINLTYHNAGSEIRNEYLFQKRNGESYIENFRIIEINMEKLKKEWYTLSRKEQERYKYLEMLDLNKKSLENFTNEGDTIMKEYEEAVKKLNTNPEFRMHITEEEDEKLVYESDIYLAEERGLKKGAKQNAIEVAKKLLSLGSNTLEQIAEATKLTIEEVKQLQNAIDNK